MGKSRKLIRYMVVPAVLLLALMLPGAVSYGQKNGIFDISGPFDGGMDGTRNDRLGSSTGFGDVWNGGGISWGGFGDADGNANIVQWQGFEDSDNPSAPVGSGLLILAASGVCYAAAKRGRMSNKR